MTYEEALEKLHELAKFGSRLGLSRMTRLMELLGNPQDRIRTIHIAGTNGKGSVCRYIYSVLLAGGYKAGLYTSPFLERFTERIEFNGAEISQDAVATYAQKVLEMASLMLEEGFDSPTEFEVITAMAFCYFTDQEADFIVLEVGLGGRGDSTNIIKKPELSVITSISYDHMEYLGETLEEIAWEKAGIIKSGVPVVAFLQEPSVLAVIKKVAAERGSRFYDAAAYPIRILEMGLFKTVFDTQIEQNNFAGVEITMIGRHQIENAVCALTAITILRNRNVILLEDQQVYNGMKHARQTGRLEILGENPYIIIDGAHNEAGAAALAEVIRENFLGQRLLLILGMLRDKKAEGILHRLLEFPGDRIATEPESPRKLEAMELGGLMAAKGKDCLIIPDIRDAIDYAMANKESYDIILFAGSLYLIGKVRSVLYETS